MQPKITVVGVGGSGSNTVSRIAKFGMPGVKLVAINTDAQALHFTKADVKIIIGKSVTRGLGAGMDANLGKVAAQEAQKEIIDAIKGSDMVFITCGLGGGTGSGATPVIADITRAINILTVAVVTTPFSFEGSQRREIAKNAINNIRDSADSFIVISNDKLLGAIDEKTTVANAFEMCDDTLRQAVHSIADLMLAPGIINIDFASVVSVMKSSGQAIFGIGKDSGDSRSIKAATKAINSPLLNLSVKGAMAVLLNVSGNDTTLNEIKSAAKIITESVDPRAQIMFGAVKDYSLKKGEIKITVIATKF
jgi:cell division protein FtsZ